jgi:hypothetical protein
MSETSVAKRLFYFFFVNRKSEACGEKKKTIQTLSSVNKGEIERALEDPSVR